MYDTLFLEHKRGVNLFCSHILETPVTEREFLEQLHELNHKINFVKEQSFKEARSCLDVKDILDKLKYKVCHEMLFSEHDLEPKN